MDYGGRHSRNGLCLKKLLTESLLDAGLLLSKKVIPEEVFNNPKMNEQIDFFKLNIIIN